MLQKIKESRDIIEKRTKLDQHLKKSRAHADVAFFLAIKNLFFKKKMLLLIIVIIGLGFLSAVITSSIIYGLKFEIEEKAISVMTGNVMIEPKTNKEYLMNVAEIEKKAYAIPGVIGVSPHVDSAVTLTDKNGKKISAQLKIIDPEKEATTTAIASNIVSGSYLSQKATGVILVGSDLTNKYRMQKTLPSIDVDSGDSVTVTFVNGVSVPMKIEGVYSLNFAITDIYVFITQEEAKQIFNMTDDDLNIASNILIKTEKRGIEDNVVYKLKEYGVSGEISTWKDKLGILDQFVNSMLIISQITAIIGMIIAFATVYIMIYINVMQKRSQIGVMKAMGIDKETILFSYIIQSVFYGVLGVIFGFILTSAVTQYFTINNIMTPMGAVIPIINTSNYIIAGVIIFCSSIVAGYLASQSIIKDNILDAIFRG